MTRRRITTLLCGIFAFDAVSTLSKAGPISDTTPAADAVFATTLYHELMTQKGNLLFAPFSIRTALGMAYAGARGQTATQIQKVLGFPDGDQNSIVRSIGDAAKQLDAPRSEYTLSVANALWGESTFPFDPAFGNELVDDFAANLHRANFLTQSEHARDAINRWVETQTAGKVAGLFPKGSISSQTALVLANAVYFKAVWQTPFLETNTLDNPFHLAPNDETNVRTMHAQLAGVPYAETDAVQAVELPYRGGLSMTLLVPKSIDGVPALEQKFDATTLQATLSAMLPQTVRVSLPKLKLNSSFALSNALGALGMTNAFDKRADFTGMSTPGSGHRSLFIGQVIHRAVAEVNEQGTEAAAATGIGMRPGLAFRRPVAVMTVNADRPFILLIRQPSSGAILFMGRVSDPR